MRKKIILRITISMLLLGGIATCTPLFISLAPNSTQLNKMPHIDVSRLPVGESILYKAKNRHLFITKHSEEPDISVVSIPFWNGLYRLPEFDWDRPVLPCKDFGAKKGDKLGCRDNESEYWWSYMHWGTNGKYLDEYKRGGQIPDLQKSKFTYKNGKVIIMRP
tara:strand:+ start:18 stop:506 length:489 start_codon:yes stop_codon:yes gene_type:complete